MSEMIFLHGWAQSRQIWCRQQHAFPDARFLNLPGHGGAAESNDWADAVIEQLPQQPAHLIGWSLGGMIAMQIAATRPERIASLTLVAATPRFRSADDWPHGSSEEVFDGFRNAVESGSPKALNRFFMLMLHGDNLSRTDYNAVARAAVDREHRPGEAALRDGLGLLEALDLRATASDINIPTLVMHGSEDAIVPFGAGAWLAQHIPGAQLQTFEQCGHAPFLTQPERFNGILKDWWQDSE